MRCLLLIGLPLMLLSVPEQTKAQSNLIFVEVGVTRDAHEIESSTLRAVRRQARLLENWTGSAQDRLFRARGERRPKLLTSPVRVDLIRDGRRVRTVQSTRGATDLTLQFDATGPRAFPEAYRTFLQTVFTNARTTMNLVFGPPAIAGPVRVANFDADIGDRDAVAGGYYVSDNGAGQREIRFPVYLDNPEATAVNFIHTLLLAYQGSAPYAFDGFQEGLARAATMRIARTPAAMSGLDPEQIDHVLQATYDVGPYYEWWNQRALAGPRFIAPNLRDTPLPVGGSLGGIYLARFLMAGSAWQKVLAEHPSFAAGLNARLHANPALSNNFAALLVAGQAVLNTIRPSDPTIEGFSFAQWVTRQFILDPFNTAGPKLHVAPLPITGGLEGPDFGVFDFQTTFFHTDANGNERLLRATAFPIFWLGTFDRVIPDAQSERMDIVAAFGSVTPNFRDEGSGNPYLVAVDVPVQDQIIRSYVPAGAVASAASPSIRDFFGTVLGVNPPAGGSLRVRARVGSTVLANATVFNRAFGARVATSTWLAPRALVLEVVSRTQAGVETVVHSRRVNKGPGGLALDIRVGGAASFSTTVPAGISAVGFPLEPFISEPAELFGVPSSQLLLARWDGSLGRYVLYPNAEAMRSGVGAFVRLPAPRTLTVTGTQNPGVPTSLALRPGWNLIAAPINGATPLSRIQVVRTNGFPASWDDAVGTDIAVDFFRFVRGSNDPASGVPETGTFVAATAFEAGQAYFVRCLAAEGATLVFSPAGFRARESRSPTHFRSPWRLQVDIAGTSARAYLQVTPGATRGFDMRFDSELPPGLGGVQIRAGSTARLYRDTRGTSGDETYTLRLEGLRPGQTYPLTFVESSRKATRITVAGPGVRNTVFTGTAQVLVPATAMQATLIVRVQGVVR